MHRWPGNSPYKWPVTRRMVPFEDVIIFHWVSSNCLDIVYAASIVHRSYNMDMIWDIRMHYNLIFTHIYISKVMKSCAHITPTGCQKAAYMLWIHSFPKNRFYKLGVAINSVWHMFRIKCWLLDSELILNHFSCYLPLIVAIWFRLKYDIIPVSVKKSWRMWPNESLEST